MREYVCDTLDDLKQLSIEVLPEVLKWKNVCFVAPMGAGKTTFIKEICKSLGIAETEIHSPTYSLVNEYKSPHYTIYHFDFYRLKNINEAYDFGLEEYFSQNAICLMEWPEIVAPLIPMPCLKIGIQIQDVKRIFTTEIINFL